MAHSDTGGYRTVKQEIFGGQAEAPVRVWIMAWTRAIISKAPLARWLLAGVALGLMLLPGEVWSKPASDFEIQGFDSELHYVDIRSRYLFDPFLILENGTWQACPCSPGSHLTIAGQDLAGGVSRAPDGVMKLAGTQVLVDGRPARVYLVTPTQVNFVLPEHVRPPMATVTLLQDGQVRGRDTVGVGPAMPDEEGSEELVSIDLEGLELTAAPGREPAVHLLTTPLSFRASLTATVTEQSGQAVPLRVMFWNPKNFSSMDLVFDSDRVMRAEFLESRGRVARVLNLGSYRVGEPYHVVVEWRRGSTATVTVDTPGEQRGMTLEAGEAPALFAAYRPSLTVLSAGRDGAAAASLTEYSLTLLPGRFTTLRVDDARIPPIMLAVGAAGAALLLLPLLRASLTVLTTVARSAARRSRRTLAAVGGRRLAGLGALGVAFLTLNGVLFTVGSHPFDMGAQTIWAYSASAYGLTDLYYLAQTVPLAEVWNGVPYHEAVFPYNFGMAYYFWFIGRFHLLLFGHISPDSDSLAITIKAFNLVFMLADAVLVYALLRTLRPSSSLLPWLGSAVMLFNPAFVFDTAVWGETESVPLFFLLASLLAAHKDRPILAWALLAGAFLTKQTVILAVLVIAVFYLLRYPWRRSLEGAATAVLLVSILSLPFVLNGYPPSVTLDPTLAVLWIHGRTGAETAFQVVSFDAFNVWTLATGVWDGASGARRFQFPDNVPALGELTYQDLGSVLLALSVLGAITWLLLHRRAARGSRPSIFLLVGIVFLAEFVLPTRSVSRYFLFPLVFGVFGLTGRARWLSSSAIVILSVTTLVGIYGSMVTTLEDFPEHAPALAPENNLVSAAMLDLFRSDLFITVAATLNLLALPLMGGALWWQTREEDAVRASVPAVKAHGRSPAEGGLGLQEG